MRIDERVHMLHVITLASRVFVPTKLYAVNVSSCTQSRIGLRIAYKTLQIVGHYSSI